MTGDNTAKINESFKRELPPSDSVFTLIVFGPFFVAPWLFLVFTSAWIAFMAAVGIVIVNGLFAFPMPGGRYGSILQVLGVVNAIIMGVLAST